MQKISEYLEHADECRRMASLTTDPSHKEALLNMAQTWKNLAKARARENARIKRIKEIESSD
jgi:hypothetical protein